MAAFAKLQWSSLISLMLLAMTVQGGRSALRHGVVRIDDRIEDGIRHPVLTWLQ